MYRCIRLLALAGALVCSLSGLHAQSPLDDSLRLPEDYFPGLKAMLDAAVKQSPRMLARNTDLALAEADRISTRAAQLPSLGGYGNYYPWTRDKRGDLTEASIAHKTGYNVAINQPIFHWGALHNNTKISELRKKVAEGAFAEAYRQLVEEIRAQYLLVVVKKAGLARARFNQQMADDGLTLARSKLEKHVISDADLFAPTIAAEQARLWTDRVVEDYDNARSYLGKLTGMPPLTDEQVPDGIPAVTPASAGIEQIASKFSSHTDPDTFGLRNMRRQIEIERLNYKVTDARLRPKFNVVFGLSQDEQTYAYSVNSNQNFKYQLQSYYTGVSVSWSIFDGFATRGAKAASLARRRQLERDYEIQTADLTEAVRRQKRQVEFSARALAIVEKQLESSTSGVKTAEDDLKRGISSENAVNAARLSFMDTQINAFTARNEYLLKVADFLSTTLQDPALVNLPIEYR